MIAISCGVPIACVERFNENGAIAPELIKIQELERFFNENGSYDPELIKILELLKFSKKVIGIDCDNVKGKRWKI